MYEMDVHELGWIVVDFFMFFGNNFVECEPWRKVKIYPEDWFYLLYLRLLKFLV